jgi:hypothetical protein
MIKSKIMAMAFLTTSLLSIGTSAFSQESAGYNAETQARKAWRQTIRETLPPKAGACYHATYPSKVWKEVGCVTAPDRPFAQWLPSANKIESMKTAANAQAQTVGDGVDYVAKVSGLISIAVGQFYSISGLTSETGYDGANDYSLQLNSNFMSSSPACSGHSGCLAWEQFVYSSGEKSLFIQYWLINYDATCPSGWNTYASDCWKNSSAVSVPTIPITELINVDLWGGANSLYDSILLTTGSYYPTAGVDSYSFNTPTTVLDLAAGWDEAEFNVFGDGGGSAATFNTGATIGVRVQLNEQGSTQTAPTCVANAGTTGETNNLTLHSCTSGVGVAGSTNPYISFTESD